MSANTDSNRPKRRKRITRDGRDLTISVPPLKVPKPFQGFVDFIRGHGVVALAIGLFLGTSLKSILDSFTQGIVNPIIGVLTGNFNLSTLSVCIQSVNGVCKSTVNYGAVISEIISFIIAAFMVYLIIRILRLDKLDKTN